MALGDGRKHTGATKPTVLEQEVYEPDLFAKRITEIPSNMKKRLAYNSNGDVEYVGYAPKGLSENADGWLLHKLTYDVNKNVTEVNIAYGSWTTRAGETYE